MESDFILRGAHFELPSFNIELCFVDQCGCISKPRLGTGRLLSENFLQILQRERGAGLQFQFACWTWRGGVLAEVWHLELKRFPLGVHPIGQKDCCCCSSFILLFHLEKLRLIRQSVCPCSFSDDWSWQQAGLGVLQSLCFILDPVWLKIPFVQLTIVGQNPVMLGHGKKTWRWNGLDTKDLCSVSIETSQGWYLPQEVLKPQIFYFENLIRWWIYHSAITFKGIIYCTALDSFG